MANHKTASGLEYAYDSGEIVRRVADKLKTHDTEFCHEYMTHMMEGIVSDICQGLGRNLNGLGTIRLKDKTHRVSAGKMCFERAIIVEFVSSGKIRKKLNRIEVDYGTYRKLKAASRTRTTVSSGRSKV